VDVMTIAELYIIIVGGALTTLFVTGVAKFIWDIFSRSTEEAAIEERILRRLLKRNEKEEQK